MTHVSKINMLKIHQEVRLLMNFYNHNDLFDTVFRIDRLGGRKGKDGTPHPGHIHLNIV